MKPEKWIAWVLCIVFSTILQQPLYASDQISQIIVSPTPVPVSLPSPLPLFTQVSTTVADKEPTRTPTPLGPVLLQAITEANVRAQPDPESERLGTIRNGDLFPVIGRYFRWYQFQYDQSPSGTGWVFDELVTILGDEASIIDLAENSEGQALTQIPDVGATLLLITQTPGGILTATASSGSIPLPGQASSTGMPDNLAPTIEVTFLPTYTFPPGVPSSGVVPTLDAIATPTAETVQTSADIFPPVLPIVILAALGALGLFVSTVWSSRR